MSYMKIHANKVEEEVTCSKTKATRKVDATNCGDYSNPTYIKYELEVKLEHSDPIPQKFIKKEYSVIENDRSGDIDFSSCVVPNTRQNYIESSFYGATIKTEDQFNEDSQRFAMDTSCVIQNPDLDMDDMNIKQEELHIKEEIANIFSNDVGNITNISEPPPLVWFSKRVEKTEQPTVHNGEKVFKCKFSQPASLKIHMRTRTSEKPFTCNICTSKCTLYKSLKTHTRIHTGEKIFNCNTCNKVCVTLSHLETHMRVHTGEKPFSCNLCTSKFRHSSTLKSQMTVHTGEKPFSCNICGSKFTQGGALKLHIRKHTGEKVFRCEVCDRICTKLSHLKTHMRNRWRLFVSEALLRTNTIGEK